MLIPFNSVFLPILPVPDILYSYTRMRQEKKKQLVLSAICGTASGLRPRPACFHPVKISIYSHDKNISGTKKKEQKKKEYAMQFTFSFFFLIFDCLTKENRL